MFIEMCHVFVSIVKIGQVKVYFIFGQDDSPLILSMDEVLCKKSTHNADEHWEVSRKALQERP
jgi:hypothetical protein